MKKFLKKIAAAAAAVAVVSTFAVGVANAAVQDEYTGYVEFGPITLKDKGGHDSTNAVQKHDYFNYAVVYFEEGVVSSSIPVHMRVITKSGQRVTGEYTATALERYPLYYTSGEGVYSHYYELSMNAGYYGLTVSGKWAP